MTCKGERHWLRLRFRGEEGLVIIGHAGWELSGSSVTFTSVAEDSRSSRTPHLTWRRFNTIKRTTNSALIN